MKDRVTRLRASSLDTVPSLSIERARLVTEAYKEHEGKVPIPVLRALTFKKLMEEKEIFIGDDES